MALKLLQRLQQIAGGRYLLMACDAGVCDEQALRLGGLTPPERWDRASAALPVNFHALSLSQRQQGAAVCNLAAGDEGMILHLACRDAGAEVDSDSFERICCGMEAAHPCHSTALRQVIATAIGGAGISSAGMLALLRRTEHDPAVLKMLCGAFSSLSPELDEGARRCWQKALAASWDNFMPLRACDDFHVDCALLAMQLGYWVLAQDCLRVGLAFYGDHPHDLYLQAWCQAATGASVDAFAGAQAALALHASHPGAQALYAQLGEKLERWRNLSWYRADLARDAELCLEPLGLEHAQDLLYQYRDDQIGIMTRLPELHTIEQTRAWISEQIQEPGRMSYTVMHACWGLVGVVSCRCAGPAGYFYYWTGCDFQQRGYGQRAARLLFQQAAAHGVTEIYTSADRANPHSRHVLRKLGFQQMAINESTEDQDFYYLGEEASSEQMLSQFQQLCMAIDEPVSAE
jgi:RimJ/RimL family protein N-acetyltransferase